MRTTQDKIIIWVTLLHSVLGLYTMALLGLNIGFGLSINAHIILAIMGVVVSIGWFKQYRWGIYLGLIFYFIQLIYITSPNFYWVFTLGVSLNIGVGKFGGYEVGLSLFAMGMLLWMNTRIRASNCPFPPKSQIKS